MNLARIVNINANGGHQKILSECTPRQLLEAWKNGGVDLVTSRWIGLNLEVLKRNIDSREPVIEIENLKS